MVKYDCGHDSFFILFDFIELYFICDIIYPFLVYNSVSFVLVNLPNCVSITINQF